MAVPQLNQDGLLPEGIHDCTLEEIKDRFGKFQDSDQRPRLFMKLDNFLTDVRKSGLIRAVLVEGSFVTGKPDPNDIDLVLVAFSRHDFAADLLPYQYTVLSRIQVRKRFGFDIVVVRENTAEFEEAVAFFHQVRTKPELRKGILRFAV